MDALDAITKTKEKAAVPMQAKRKAVEKSGTLSTVEGHRSVSQQLQSKFINVGLRCVSITHVLDVQYVCVCMGTRKTCGCEARMCSKMHTRKNTCVRTLCTCKKMHVCCVYAPKMYEEMMGM